MSIRRPLKVGVAGVAVGAQDYYWWIWVDLNDVK